MERIVATDQPSEDDNNVIRNAMAEFNAYILAEKPKPFSVFLKDEEEKIYGGLLSYMYSDSMFIDLLWIDEKSRGQRYGSKLLKRAEEEAIKNGCSCVTVNTFSFQAEKFFRKHDYEEMAVVKNFILEHSRIFLRKALHKKTHKE